MILKNLQSLYICSSGKAVNYSTVREARCLNKLLTKGQRKKRLHNNQLPSRSSSITYIRDTLKKKNIIRMSALNKIFMKHITEILETNECAEELHKYGIQITNVLVTSDYNFMNIFWTNSRKSEELKANEILLKTTGLLRYELSALKIVGHVPEIQFLKDTEQLRNEELNRILNELDKFSEDHNRLNIEQHDYAEPNVEEIQIKRNQSSKLPVMSHNIFGLNHSDILKKILLKKAQTEAEKFRFREVCNDEDKNSSEIWQFDKKLLSKKIFEKKYLKRKMMRIDRKAATFFYDTEEQSSGTEADVENLEDEPEESQDV